ncbi:PREDICTED: uncharacterized protein LOC109209473 [Nicotiana attenuata]|uniref:uncharacterized protein LOC109209473 n=1 Tax=Nicotiana attenuata TaxID=49451 RepID=UPI0009046A47|nr:PREDICTED: uncharacterized protein LOC109209473 [Nicotiana attenuata]
MAMGQGHQMQQVQRMVVCCEICGEERRIGGLGAQQNTRPTGTLPSDTKKNPIEQVQAINLSSGKAFKEVPLKQYVPKELFERLVPQPEVEAEKKDDEHRKEIEVRVNLPLVEVMQEVPKYAKYLRDIVVNKRRLTEFETVALTEECSARVQSKLPPKLKNSGCFTIPLAIAKYKLNLGAPRPTTITLHLADRSLAVPEGIIEDVLVQVGKFIFPADFIILDYMADEEVPIILGRPFLATGGALINVREDKLKMIVHDEEVTFNVYNELNLPKHYEDLCMISVVESKLIEQGLYMEPSSMEKKIRLEEVVLQAECVKVEEKRVREERGDPPRARKKEKLHGKRRK